MNNCILIKKLTTTFFLTKHINKLMLLLLLYFTVLAFPLSAKMPANIEDLEIINSPHFDSFMVAQKAVFPKTKKIYITDVSATFSNDWLREFRGKTTKNYRNKVLHEYSNMLKTHIKTKLTEAGWQVVDNNEADALSITAQLKDIFINGPQKVIREQQLVRNIGQSSIVFGVNGVDNNTILILEDRRNIAGLEGYFIETDNSTNFTFFNRVVEQWTNAFVAYLNVSNPEK